MDKLGKKELNIRKNSKIPFLSKISKKDNLIKDKPVNTILKTSKKECQNLKENLKSNNKQQNININSIKFSMDTKEKNSRTNFNTISNNNNMADSLEVLKEKKNIIKKELYNKKINLKAKYKNSDEVVENDLYFSNVDYNVNPFLKNINSSNNNSNNKYNKKSSSSVNKEIDKNKEIKIININKNKIYSNNIRQTYNPDNFSPIDFIFEKKNVNTIVNKDKDNIYKNRFLTKKNKKNNNIKERKSEGSFGSIIFQKKKKLFSLSNDQNNNYFKESAISSKNIKNQAENKENQTLTEIKDDLNKITNKKIQISGKKQNKIKKKISYNKLNKLDNNINKNNIINSSHKENKKIVKLETKINKNREILFNSKGKIAKEKVNEKKKNTFKLIFPDIKKNIDNDNNNDKIIKNIQRSNINSKKIFEKKITYFPQPNKNLGNKTLNLIKNKNNLCYSNSILTKNKLEEKIEKKLELKDNINKHNNDKDNNNKNDNKNENNNNNKENIKEILYIQNNSPKKVNIDLEKDKYQAYNDIDKDIFSDKLLSERFSPEKRTLKNNSKKENISYSMENFSLYYKYNNANKSPQIKRKNEINKIIRIKTEMNDDNKIKKNKSINKINNKANSNNNINIYLNLNIEKKIISKEAQGNKNKKHQNQLFNGNMIMPLNTLDNELFKKSTVKKLIKNNQYKALLSEITIKSNKSKNKTKVKEKKKVKDNITIKKKFRFSERKRGSHKHESKRRLTESSEKYYDLYKKAFNDNILEQKFSFRPKSKNKNLYYNYSNKLNDNDVDINDNIIYNKKGSITSFNAKERQILDNEINIKEYFYHKNLLSNNLDKNNLTDKENEIEIESDNNKNFILDLNHFIPIDENKLKNTISKPLFENNKLK